MTQMVRDIGRAPRDKCWDLGVGVGEREGVAKAAVQPVYGNHIHLVQGEAVFGEEVADRAAAEDLFDADRRVDGRRDEGRPSRSAPPVMAIARQLLFFDRPHQLSIDNQGSGVLLHCHDRQTQDDARLLLGGLWEEVGWSERSRLCRTWFTTEST